MLKTFANFEFMVAGKVAKFLFEHDSSAPMTLEILKEMAFQITNFVAQVEMNSKAQADQQAKIEQNAVVEATKEADKE